MLDLFPQARQQLLDEAAQNPVPGLEPTFGESFSTAWNENLRYSQSLAAARLRDEIVGEKLDQFYNLSGQRVAFPRSPIGSEPAYAVPYGMAKRAVDKWNEQQPEDTIEQQSTRFRWPSDDEIRAEIIKRSRAARADEAEMLARPQAWASWFGSKAGDLAGTATEPWNIALMGIGAPWSAGVLRFALTEAGLAAFGQTAAEVQSFGFKREVNPQHSVGEAVGEVAGAAAGGALFGGALKGVVAVWRRVKTGAWSRDVIDAGHVVQREAEIAASNPFPGAEGELAHRAAMQKAAEDLAAGRPVDLSQVLEPEVFRAYSAVIDARTRSAGEAARASELDYAAGRLPPTMERLSELQLAQYRHPANEIEARAIATRHMFDEDSAKLAKGREDLTARTADAARLRGEVAALRDELAGVTTQASELRARQLDPSTQARLVAIETALPGATKKQRARLETERDTITETLAKIAPEEARLNASLEQQAAGLQLALTRRERMLAKLEATAETTDARLASREADLERKRIGHESKVAAQNEAAVESTRRAVARLAQEGYGVRLTRDEAREMAERIIRAPEAETESVLRQTTEELVSRARAPQPGQLPFGTPQPAEQARARSQYWDTEMRKAIQALGREIGSDVSREEASRIAAQIAKLPDDKALAMINELLPLSQNAYEAMRVVRRSADRVTELSPLIDHATTPKAIAAARNAPGTHDALLNEASRIMLERPDFEIRVPVGQADGSTTYVRRKLADMLGELDGELAAAKDIRGCAIGRDS